MTDATVLIEHADGVATVTLNRPEVRNALTSTMMRELVAVMDTCEQDGSVGVIIITGADPAFCAGLDLRELGSTGENVGGTPPAATGGFWRTTSKPVIAAVNGAAVTGGLEIVLECDFVVASERARFADTHTRVGVLPGGGMSVLLPQAIGVRRAREYSLTGNFFTAEQAAAWGLVNRVVPHDDLLTVARSLAGDIRSAPPDSSAAMLALSRRTAATTADEGLQIEAETFREWRRKGFDPATVESRRAGIVERGRGQQG